MNATALDAFRNRPMVVTTTEHCDHCGTLQPKVEKREAKCYWPSWEVSMKSCANCFEAAKKKAADDAYSGSVCC